MELKKILKVNRRLLITTIISIIIAIVMMVIGSSIKSEASNVKAKDYNELISKSKDDEGVYASVEIVEEPYLIATETINSVKKKYYIVYDENDYMYVVRLTDKTYEKLCDEYRADKKHFSYELKGYLYNVPTDLKEIIISTFNEDNPDNKISNISYSNYFGSTYLDETNSPTSSGLFYGIGVIAICFAISFGIVFIIYKVKSNSSLKKIDKDELEDELARANLDEYKKVKIYLTERYIVSMSKGLKVFEYNDLVWVYVHKNYVNGILTNTSLFAYTQNGKKHIIATSHHNDKMLESVIMEIQVKNPNVMAGYSPENFAQYKEIKSRK